MEDVIDPVINKTCSDQEQVLRCIQVGLFCTEARASLSTFNLMLSTDAMMLADRTKPTFVSSVATHNTEYTSNPGSPNHGSSHTSATIYLNGSSASSHTPLVPSNTDASISKLEPR